MVKRNSPNDIHELEELTRIDEIVVDKRNAKRSSAKKVGAIGTIKTS